MTPSLRIQEVISWSKNSKLTTTRGEFPFKEYIVWANPKLTAITRNYCCMASLHTINIIISKQHQRFKEADLFTYGDIPWELYHLDKK